MKLPISSSLQKLCASAPQAIYVVGGYVRNYLANLGETDVDLAGQGLLILPDFYKVNTINFRLGTVQVRNKEATYEYTPFRKESYSGGKHSPDEVNFSADLTCDSARRDFTCNCVYYNVKKDEFVDPYNGMKDIENKIVRAVNTEKTFDADGLRLLRLVRIAVETGFKIDAATANAAAKRAELLADISAERKRDELNKILVADTKNGIKNAQYRGLKLLKKLGFLGYLIPELLDCDGVAQNSEYHKYDVLEHIFQTVRFSDPSVRLSALFHDIGKAETFRRYGNMHGHEVASEYITRLAMGSFGLKYSNDEIDEVAALVKNHMYDLNGATSEAKVRIFIAKNFAIIDKLVMLMNADKLATGMAESVSEPHRLTVIRDKMTEEKTPIELSDLAVGGSAMVSLGFVGEEIGRVLEELHRQCIINPKLNTASWIMDTAAKKLAELRR